MGQLNWSATWYYWMHVSENTSEIILLRIGFPFSVNVMLVSTFAPGYGVPEV